MEVSRQILTLDADLRAAQVTSVHLSADSHTQYMVHGKGTTESTMLPRIALRLHVLSRRLSVGQTLETCCCTWLLQARERQLTAALHTAQQDAAGTRTALEQLQAEVPCTSAAPIVMLQDNAHNKISAP